MPAEMFTVPADVWLDGFKSKEHRKSGIVVVETYAIILQQVRASLPLTIVEWAALLPVLAAPLALMVHPRWCLIFPPARACPGWTDVPEWCGRHDGRLRQVA